MPAVNFGSERKNQLTAVVQTPLEPQECRQQLHAHNRALSTGIVDFNHSSHKRRIFPS